MSKQTYFDKAIEWVKRKSHLSLKANYEGFESPKSFKNISTKKSICPDITFVGPRGRKNYTEIAVKGPDPSKVVTRWKLLSTLASIKNGTLYILAPRGNRSYADKLVQRHSIDATVVSI